MTAEPHRNLTSHAGSVARWIHRWFMPLLITIDLLAFFWPQPGLGVRGSWFSLPSLGIEATLPSIMLAAMLFCAGLNLRREHLTQIARQPWVPLLGTVACWLLPICLLLLLKMPATWILPENVAAEVWLGLVVVAAMPAAQSSVAWTQNSGGNVLLCLAIVLLTTYTSPWITPELIRWFSNSTALSVGANIQEVISARILLIWVIIPSLLGSLLALAAGVKRIEKVRPWLNLASCLMLLALNYLNAANSLPQLWQSAAGEVIFGGLLLATGLCLGSFGAALLLARVLKLQIPEKAALVYALGMKNNGVALMLTAEQTLAQLPLVNLVLMCYILLQHFTAGVLGNRWIKQADELSERAQEDF